MTRFVIGVGTYGVPGSYIDISLQNEFPGSEVNPIAEAPYTAVMVLPALYQRSIHFAERMRHHTIEPGDFYVGVASGLVKLGIHGTGRKSVTRVEVASIVRPDGTNTNIATCLNQQDVLWQIRNKKCAEESCLESVTQLMLILHKTVRAHAAQK